MYKRQIHGVNPYSKFLEERGPGIHHIKESVLDNDALDAAVAEYSSRGPKVNYQGKYMEDHYFYLDTFDALGAYYELSLIHICGISGSRQPYGILEMIIKKLFIYSLPCFFCQEFRKASGFA